MCHAGLVNNSLVTDYDIGVLPSKYQDYLKSMVGVQHDKTLKINTHKGVIMLAILNISTHFIWVTAGNHISRWTDNKRIEKILNYF
jgi:hypothetical protein